jgi:TolB-like protein/Tfp pilus assembly protein PilF
MKRCPQCNRIENDDALAYCRIDGTALIRESGSISGGADTAKFGSASESREIETSILPHRTDADMSRPTAPTTVLPAAHEPGTTSKPSRPKRRPVVIALAVAVVVALIAVAGYLYFTRNRSTAIDSIAVLPFDDQNRDSDSEYLSDGLTESVINNLTQLANLRVVARNTAFRYKGKTSDPIAAGNELGVRAVLTGRVLQRGDNLLVSAELIDVRENKQLWGQQYNRKLAEAVDLQEEIAKTISDRLRLNLSGEEQKRLAKRPTENPEAYQLYLKGNYYTAKFTKAGLDKGMQYFNQAIAIDPNYALAYDGIAFYYITAVGFYVSDQEAMPKVREAANKAIAIDETLGEPHNSLALVHWWFERDWTGAEKEFKRGIELNPNYPRIHWFYGWFLIVMGRTEEGIRESKRAVEIDPLSPETNLGLGQNLFFAGHYDEAIAQLKATLELDQNFFFAHDYLGRAYEARGKFPEAISEFKRALELEGDLPENWSNLGHAYAVSGKPAEAHTIVERLKRLSAAAYVPAYNMAALYSGLGNKNESFTWLNQAEGQRSFYLAAYLKTDPQFANLRSDPRFNDLVRRVGLPP